MRAYPEKYLERKESVFNYCLLHAGVVVGSAFGIFKSMCLSFFLIPISARSGRKIVRTLLGSVLTADMNLRLREIFAEYFFFLGFVGFLEC